MRLEAVLGFFVNGETAAPKPRANAQPTKTARVSDEWTDDDPPPPDPYQPIADFVEQYMSGPWKAGQRQFRVPMGRMSLSKPKWEKVMAEKGLRFKKMEMDMLPGVPHMEPGDSVPASGTVVMSFA